MKIIKRNITLRLLDALKDTPVVLLQGARQTGKSTLVQLLARKQHPAEYLTLDDLSIYSAIKDNPDDFLNTYSDNIILDEVQKAPELFRAIKSVVDKNRKPGKFILTGSANILLLPKISESLAGRIEILQLYPFSQSEIMGNKINVLDRLFTENMNIKANPADGHVDIYKNIVVGGYPEAVFRKTDRRRNAWFESYAKSMLQRDIKELSHIESIAQFPKLLNLLAARTGALLNFAEISRAISIPQTSLKRYFTLLEASFLVYLLPPYYKNRSKRLIKTAKIYFNDTGLLSHQLSININGLKKDKILFGHILENYVLMELIKYAAWSDYQYKFYHYRTVSGREIDFIIERSDGKTVAIEVKSSANTEAKMFVHIKDFESEIGKNFHRGYVFYLGNKIFHYSKNRIAVPINII